MLCMRKNFARLVRRRGAVTPQLNSMEMALKKTVLKLGLALATSSALAAASLAATPANVLVVAKNISDMVSLDPAATTELSSYEVTTNVYQRLFRYDAEDLKKLVGDAIEGWTVSPDGKSFKLTVKSGLKFASGNPLTAEDVAWSLQRSVLIGRLGANFFGPLGWTADNVKTLVKADDPKSLTLTIVNDFAPSLVQNILATNVASVLDSKTVMSHEKSGDMGQDWLRTNTAGSGAFKVRSWSQNEAVTMERNDNFAGPKPAMERIVVRHVAESTAQRLLLEKGDIDIARDLSPDQIAALAGNRNIRVESWGKGDQYYLGMNQRDPLLANPAVQQAVRWSIDYQGMADTFLKGRAKVRQTFLPAEFQGAIADAPYKFDPDRALKALKDAGLKTPIDIKLNVPSQSPLPEIAQAMQATMAKGGINLQIQQAEARQVITRYRAGQHSMVLLYWSPDYFDPHGNANTFTRNVDKPDAKAYTTVASRNGWITPETTAIADAARAERDPAKRFAMYADLQRKVAASGPFVFMFQTVEQVAQRANVKGFIVGPNGDTVFYRRVTK